MYSVVEDLNSASGLYAEQLEKLVVDGVMPMPADLRKVNDALIGLSPFKGDFSKCNNSVSLRALRLQGN